MHQRGETAHPGINCGIQQGGGGPVPGSVVPRLGSAFASMTSPVALILDDVHLLRNSECRAALSVLADHVPKGSRLALSGRGKPPLRVAAACRGQDP